MFIKFDDGMKEFFINEKYLYAITFDEGFLHLFTRSGLIELRMLPPPPIEGFIVVKTDDGELHIKESKLECIKECHEGYFIKLKKHHEMEISESEYNEIRKHLGGIENGME